MRHVWIGTLLLSLGVVACTNAPVRVPTALLAPDTIEMKGYVGLVKKKTVQFSLDGQPVRFTDLSVTGVGDDQNVITLSALPLSDATIVSCSPIEEGQATATFSVVYREQEHRVTVACTSVTPPFCEMSTNPCETIVFDPDTEQCEPVAVDGGRCDDFTDCAHPGICSKGECVLQEIGHDAPSCDLSLTPQPLSPLWSYPLASDETFAPPIAFDDDGNSYFFDSDPDALVSLAPDGTLRWRAESGPDTFPGDTINNKILVSSGHVYALSPTGPELRVFRQDNGTLEWRRSFFFLPMILPVGDALWMFEYPQSPWVGELNVYDGATGLLQRTIEQPLEFDGIRVAYSDLMASADGPAYLVGQDADFPPQFVAVAALDRTTGATLWTAKFDWPREERAYTTLLGGTTLLFSSGAAIDLVTRTFFRNEAREMLLGSTTAFFNYALGADGTGYTDLRTFDPECDIATLGRFHAQESAADWSCFLGAQNLNGGLVGVSANGSAIVLTSRAEEVDGDLTRWPLVHLIGTDGKERYSGELRFNAPQYLPDMVVGIRGSRLMLRQSDPLTRKPFLVAYNIPELVTQ